MSKRLFFVVNVDWFFVSHRLPIALSALQSGYEVHLASRFTDHRSSLSELGIICHDIDIERSTSNVFSMLHLVLQLRSLYACVQPDIVHLVTIQPVLLGGIAARLSGVNRVVASISGLGFVFIDRGFKAEIVRFVVALLYSLALGGKNVTIIVQNTDDEAVIRKIVKKRNLETVLIPGSGVDLDKYAHMSLPSKPLRVLMAARLLSDKGVREYVDAARVLVSLNTSLQFLLAGEIDPGNPASVTKAEVDAWRVDGNVEICGHVENMSELIASCHMVALPSYREGMPKILLEAAACGRAVITTDVPGCRDAIVPGETGLLVEARSAQALAEAVVTLAGKPKWLAQMGARGRRLAVDRFDVKAVVRDHLTIYADQ